MLARLKEFIRRQAKPRRVAIRLLLLLATLISIMGFTMTNNFAFVGIPFVVGTIIVMVVLRWRKTIKPEEAYSLRVDRMLAVLQLAVASIMATLFLFYAIENKSTEVVIGYVVILVPLLGLSVLSVLHFAHAVRCGREFERTEGSADEIVTRGVRGVEDRGHVSPD